MCTPARALYVIFLLFLLYKFYLFPPGTFIFHQRNGSEITPSAQRYIARITHRWRSFVTLLLTNRKSFFQYRCVTRFTCSYFLIFFFFSSLVLYSFTALKVMSGLVRLVIRWKFQRWTDLRRLASPIVPPLTLRFGIAKCYLVTETNDPIIPILDNYKYNIHQLRLMITNHRFQSDKKN